MVYRLKADLTAVLETRGSHSCALRLGEEEIDWNGKGSLRAETATAMLQPLLTVLCRKEKLDVRNLLSESLLTNPPMELIEFFYP